MKTQKSFEGIAQKVQSLKEGEQGKLKGGFAAITPASASSPGMEECNGNCGCGCHPNE